MFVRKVYHKCFKMSIVKYNYDTLIYKNDTFILKQIIEGLLRLAGIVLERAESVKTRRQKT